MNSSHVFNANAMVAAMALAFAGGSLANPVNPVVAAGQAMFQQNGKTLTVTNTPSAIINWQSFNIDRGELTRFVQQSAASQVLNRVTGGDPSKILGGLQSNGRVILINPNGVAFGKGAQVDVAGLLVSTLQLKDADFLAGKLKFNDTPGAGSIKNEGTIKTASGGQVILIAPQIENSGLIYTPEGQIMLLAGKSVTIADPDKPAIQVEITNSEQQAVNIGTLIGKEISLYGGIVRNSGTIQATTAVVGQNGKISLRAKYEVENTGTLQANGAQGGDIVIQAEQGMASVQGLVEAKALKPEQIVVQQQNIEQKVRTASQPLITLAVETPAVETPSAFPESTGETIISLQAETLTPASTASPASDNVWVKTAAAVAFTDSSIAQATPASGPLSPLDSSPINPQNPMLPTRQAGVGGSVRILGRRVGVLDGATIDTTGPSGGGEILVGGDWQGHNPNVQNAQATFVAATARVDASASEFGNGGKVVVWADDAARVYGHIAARGGALGGDGGNIETSGKHMLEVTQVADASAPRGKGGLWLLDPNNVTIQTTGPDSGVTGNPNFSTTGDGAIITVATLQAALNAGTNVTITTSAGGAQAGDITIANAISKTAGGDATLTLTAHNNININAGISSTVNKLNLVLNANSDVSGGGAASMGSSTLALNGGTLGSSNGFALTASAGTLNNVTLATNLSLTGSTTLTGGLTLSGSTVTINSGGTLYYSGTQTLGGTGNLVFAGASTTWLYRSGAAATLTVGPNVTVSGSGTGQAIFGYYSDEAINFQGTLNANVTGKTWYLGGFNNTGNINVSAGTVRMDTYGGTGSWSNTSTALKGIAISGGALVLDDSINASALGNITQSGSGTVSLGGTLILDQASTNLSNAGLTSMDLGSGAIVTGGGNTLTANAGFALTASAGTLNNVTLATNLSLTGSTTLTGGLTLSGSTVTINSGGTLYYSGTQTLGGTGNLVFAGASTTWLYRSGAAATLTVGPNVTVSGSGTGQAIFGYYSDEAINFQGTLNANVTGKTWYLGGFNNTGNINVSAGTVRMDTYGGTGSWSNSGSLLWTGGSLILDDSISTAGFASITNNSGTALNITGTINNTGNTLLINSQTGDVQVSSGGVISGGIIQTANGKQLLANGGTLSNVTLDTDLTLMGDSLNITGDLILNAGRSLNLNAGSQLYFDSANASLLRGGSGTANVVFGSDVSSASTNYIFNYNSTAGNVLTLGAGVSVGGASSLQNGQLSSVYGNGAITNQGTISSATAGSTITLSGFPFTNNGTLSASNGGTLAVSSGSTLVTTGAGIDLQAGGILDFNGTQSVTGAIAINTGATVNFRNGITTAEIGNYTFAGGMAVLTSTLTNSGTLTLAGTSGSLRLGSGGRITGGTVATSGGVTLSSTAGTLDGVTLATDMTVENNGTLTVLNGLTFSGGKKISLTSNAGYAYLYVNGTGAQTIGGTGSIEFAGTGNQHYVTYSSGTPTLSLGTGVTVNALAGGSFWDTSQAWTLNGAFNVNAPAATVTTNVANITRGGGSTVNVQSGTLRLDGADGDADYNGAWAIASGATLNLNHSGTRTLAAGYLATGSGSIINQFATLNINGMGNNTLRFGGTGVTNFNSAITIGGLDAAGTLGINANVVSSGLIDYTSGSALSIAAGSTLTANGGMNWSTGSTVNGGGTLLIPSGQTLALTGGSKFLTNATITNQGTTSLNLTAGNVLYLSTNAAIINSGTWTFAAAANGVITNSGTSTITNTGLVQNTGAGTASFGGALTTFSSTSASYANSGGGVLNLGSGVSNVYSGTTTFTGTGVTLSTGTHAFAAGSVLNGPFALGAATATFNTSTVNGLIDFTGTGTLSVNGGNTLTLNGGLNWAGGGAINGAGALTINSLFTWNGGTISGTGALNTNGTVNVTAPVVGILSGKNWNNTGIINIPVGSGGLELNSATLNNSSTGSINITSADTTPIFTVGGGVVNNAGTFTYNNAASVGINTSFTNTSTGIANIDAGTLQLSSFPTNSGILNIASGATLSTNGNNLTNALTSGLINGSGTLNLGSATLTNNGTLKPGGTGAAGTLSITGNLINNGTIEAELGGTTAGTQYDVLAVSGNVTLGGTLNSSLINSYVPTVGPNFDIITAVGTASGSFTTLNVYSGINGAIVGGNTYRLNYGGLCGGVCWDGGGGADTNWNTLANWTGDVLPGSTDIAYLNLVAGVTVQHTTGIHSIKGLNSDANNALNVSGGTLTLNDAATTSTLNGALTINGGTLTANGTINAVNLNLSSGTLTGTGALNITNGFTWSGGTQSGSGSTTVGSGASFILDTSSGPQLSGRSFTNNGTGTWNGVTYIYIGNGGSFTNAGTLTATGNAAVYNNLGGSGSFTNSGTFTKTTGTGTTLFSNGGNTLNFTNSGMIDVLSGSVSVNVTTFDNSGSVAVGGAGTFNLNANGTNTGSYNLAAGGVANLTGGVQTFNAGSNITGAGSFVINGGTLTDATTLSASNLTLAGGTLNGVGALTITNGFTWSGGTQSGSGSTTVGSGASFILDTSSGPQLSGRSFTNNGTGTWNGVTYIYIGNGGSFTNAGTLTATGNAAVYNNLGGSGSFTNSGTFTKTTGTGTTLFSNGGNLLNVTNSGTVNIDAGTLQLSSFPINSGTMNIASGATLSTNGNNLTNALTGGVINGSGTLNLGSATLTNNGTLRPGGTGAAGTLSIAGNIINSGSGIIEAEIGGVTAGTQYDVLTVSGNVTLGGTLNGTLINSFVPAGQSFDIITAGGTASGSFTTLNLPSGVNGSIVGNLFRLTHAGACAGI